MQKENFLWTEKYRPRKVEDTILPNELKAIFKQFVEQKSIPNLLLSGTAGLGKTTIARAMLDELKADYIIINGSMKGNIDTLRNEILEFAQTVSFYGGRKYVILDEADYLNPNSTQPALRNFMEEYAKNCGFILTCNYKNKIIPALHSRCSVIDFTIKKKDSSKLAAQFYTRVLSILDKEGIPYQKPVVAQFIQKYYPDWRRIINELQTYSATGGIDTGILVNIQETSIKDLVTHLKSKNITEVRKWVVENLDTDPVALFRIFYDNASDYFKKDSVPQLVLFLAKYQYQAAFVADHEINFMAFLIEIMVECEFL